MYDEMLRQMTALGLPAPDQPVRQSPHRFADGAQVRVEIPSCEGPVVLRAVLEEAERLQVKLHRVSQGSGIMMMTDAELREMAQLGAEAGIEVSLFVGPRAGWHLSALAKSPAGGAVNSRIKGSEMLAHAVADVRRAYGLGIRSVLVADEGLLWMLGAMRRRGDLPADLRMKVSVMQGVANPASLRLLADLGADTINVATDLTTAELAQMRAAVTIPLDVYVEAPDDLGGFVRYYDIPEIVRAASPVYIKYGVRNAPGLYPSGRHLEDLAVRLGRERVRRARIGQEMLERALPDAVFSQPGRAVADLAIPVV